MNQWKHIFSLVKMELKASVVNLLLCWLVLSVFGIMIFFEVGMQYLKGNGAGYYDLFLYVLFGFSPYWFRAKHFQYNKLSGNLWASPTLIMQSQLPIPKDILVRSRLIIYLVYYLPAAFTILLVSYVISSDLRILLSPSAYLVFAFIWLSVGLCFGIIIAASDVGDFVTKKIMFFYSIMMLVIIFGLYLLFYNVLGKGLVSYAILLANQYPFPAIIACFMLLIASFLFWPNYMKKTMQKLDYF